MKSIFTGLAGFGLAIMFYGTCFKLGTMVYSSWIKPMDFSGVAIFWYGCSLYQKTMLVGLTLFLIGTPCIFLKEK